MAKPTAPLSSPDPRFRPQIEAALAAGSAPDDLVLQLTHRDVSVLSRDPTTPLSDISYQDGVMRFLGVRIEKGGVPVSVLHRGGAA